LKYDGTIVAWGADAQGQCDVPAPNRGFLAIAAGLQHSLGLKSDGTIVGWGNNYGDAYNYLGQSQPPVHNSDFVAIAAGEHRNLAVKRRIVTAADFPTSQTLPTLSSAKITSVAPNPFNPSVEIRFQTRSQGSVRLEIFDVRGASVASILLGSLGSGPHRARWNGRDDAGRNVSSGVYFLRVNGTAGQSRTVKVVLVR
jgi:hypothetical protein